MSSPLVWQLVRNGGINTYVKRNGVTLDKASANNKFSSKTVAAAQVKNVNVVAKGDKIVLVKNNTKKFGAAQIGLKKNFTKVAAKTIAAETTKAYYRADLAKFALYKYLALNKALNKAKKN